MNSALKFFPKAHLLLIPILLGCSAEVQTDKPTRADKAPAVEVVQAQLGTVPLEERLSGVVKAKNQLSIRPEIEAPVVEILVESGDAVTAGQPLVRLDDTALREQLRQAEASVRLARAAADEARARLLELEAQLSRTRKLAAEQLISDLELETREAQLLAAQASANRAMAQVEQAEATTEERRARFEKTVIRAPIDGRVGQRTVALGMLAGPGTVLFEIGDLADLMIEVPLTEKMLGYVDKSMPVRITGIQNTVMTARISRISPFLSAGSFSTVAEIDVTDPAGPWRPGMFVQVDVLYGESETVTLLPTSALWNDPGSRQRGIYVLRTPGNVPADLSDDSFTLGFQAADVIAEGRGVVGLRGVDAGQWVVTVGQNLLRGTGDQPARARAVSWDDMLALQGLQREDLLNDFLAKQRHLAKERGAQPPSSDEYMVRSSAVPAIHNGPPTVATTTAGE